MNRSIPIILFCLLLCTALSLAAASASAAAPILGNLDYYARNGSATAYVSTVMPVMANGTYVYDLGIVDDSQKPIRLVISIKDTDGTYNPGVWYNVTPGCDKGYGSCLSEYTGFTIPEVSSAHRYFGWYPRVCDATHTASESGGCYDAATGNYDFLYPYPYLVTPTGPSTLSMTFADKENNTARMLITVTVRDNAKSLIGKWYERSVSSVAMFVARNFG